MLCKVIERSKSGCCRIATRSISAWTYAASEMFDGGLIEEVRHILALGYPETAKPFESHGYKQALQLLHGELTLKEAVNYAQRNTRRYAKRQITWFRREADLLWLKGFGAAPDVRESAFHLVQDLTK